MSASSSDVVQLTLRPPDRLAQRPFGDTTTPGLTASVTTNRTVNVTFSIAGGSDAVLYDIYANTVLDFSSSTNQPWSWMGQGTHCVVYSLTNLPGIAQKLAEVLYGHRQLVRTAKV